MMFQNRFTLIRKCSHEPNFHHLSDLVLFALFIEEKAPIFFYIVFDIIFDIFVCETADKIPFHLKITVISFLSKEDLPISHKTFPLRSDNTHRSRKKKENTSRHLLQRQKPKQMYTFFVLKSRFLLLPVGTKN